MEKLFSYVPFTPKIESRDIARTLMIDAENTFEKGFQKEYEN